MGPESMQLDKEATTEYVSIEDLEKSRFALTALKLRLRSIPEAADGEDEYNTIKGYKKVSRETINFNKLLGVWLMNGWALHVSTISDGRTVAHRFNIEEIGEEISYYREDYGENHTMNGFNETKLEGLEAITADDQSRGVLLGIWESMKSDNTQMQQFDFLPSDYKMPLAYVSHS